MFLPNCWMTFFWKWFWTCCESVLDSITNYARQGVHFCFTTAKVTMCLNTSTSCSESTLQRFDQQGGIILPFDLQRPLSSSARVVPLQSVVLTNFHNSAVVTGHAGAQAMLPCFAATFVIVWIECYWHEMCVVQACVGLSLLFLLEYHLWYWSFNCVQVENCWSLLMSSTALFWAAGHF